jgi:hypothetical protein
LVISLATNDMDVLIKEYNDVLIKLIHSC